MFVYLFLVLVLVVLDQLSKFWIVNRLSLGQEIQVIDNFFSLNHVRNSGAAWGFLSDKSWGIGLLTIVSALASLVLIYLLLKIEHAGLRLSLSLIVAGSIGNLIDRFRLGEVIDFISFRFGTYQFPSFNLADSCIVVGAVCLLFVCLISKEASREFLSVLGND